MLRRRIRRLLRNYWRPLAFGHHRACLRQGPVLKSFCRDIDPLKQQFRFIDHAADLIEIGLKNEIHYGVALLN